MSENTVRIYLTKNLCLEYTKICYASKINSIKNGQKGVPVVAQWLKNPTRNHEVVGLIPALAQCVKDLVLP